MKASLEQIRDKKEAALKRIADFHLRPIANIPGNVFLISTAYPGVWMEHAFDGLCYANLNPGDPLAAQVAKNQMLLFIRNRLPDGHLPYNVLDEGLMRQKKGYTIPIGYGQIQECVSFARLCFETWQICGEKDFLEEAYEACEGWDRWLCENRMTLKQGLIETFCVFDTGHDNSARFAGIENGCPDREGKKPSNHTDLPILSPDMNAVFFADRMALSDMARELGKENECRVWRRKADQVRQKMFERLYDEKEAFFFDADRQLRKRPLKTISITNVFGERVLTQAEFDTIYERHMKNPDEFGAAYPFPSLSLDQSRGMPHAEKNCWGYFSQALTALRAQRWMDFYGRSSDYDRLLEKWVDRYAQQEEALFTQEMDPYTGVLTDCSRWYSSAMLLYLYGVKRLGLA